MRSTIARHVTNLGSKMHHCSWFVRLTYQKGKNDEHKLVRVPGVMLRKPILHRFSAKVLLDVFWFYPMCSFRLILVLCLILLILYIDVNNVSTLHLHSWISFHSLYKLPCRAWKMAGLHIMFSKRLNTETGSWFCLDIHPYTDPIALQFCAFYLLLSLVFLGVSGYCHHSMAQLHACIFS